LLTISNGNVSVKSLGRPLNRPGFNDSMAAFTYRR
jgi:hypothetical protein